jgi:molecular chaperone DnaK (HSP70)
MTEEEKREQEALVEKRNQLADEIEQFKRDLKDPKMAKYKRETESEIEFNQRLIDMIDNAAGLSEKTG